ncbi:DUF3151 domain-containing protein [Actinopolymorpha singaporensis]|uniref:DUF3151 domain-containing protein n=1 Tax=Actinopolymorpha singaporensis TaxID=117157 RepID=A0A1H1LUF1_9ACTN|nr:DUF3151 domain-containing protein [Actinopolymorpha singaporensis]SDR77952.1 Protein of unknown function [Actinopolymorpha singaporensis]
MSMNLLGEPPATELPEDTAARAALDEGTDAADVARAHPTYSLAWAMLAEHALAEGRDLEGYAYARVGYHRGLDSLRRSGWRGHGPVPWEHVPNRGFLRALAALAKAAGSIGEADEAERCSTFLAESSATAAEELGLAG